MTAPYSGITIAHPDRKLARTYTGRVQDQTDEIAQMMSMLRTGWSTERAIKPTGDLTIKLANDEFVFGTLLIEHMSSVRNGICQFILTRWEEQIFHWYLVQIKTDDTLLVEEYVNPPDPTHFSTPRILA